MFGSNYKCAVCGFIGKPKTVTPGSFFIELILWLTIVLGLIYTIRRYSVRYKACKRCGARNIRAISKQEEEQEKRLAATDTQQ